MIRSGSTLAKRRKIEDLGVYNLSSDDDDESRTKGKVNVLNNLKMTRVLRKKKNLGDGISNKENPKSVVSQSQPGKVPAAKNVPVLTVGNATAEPMRSTKWDENDFQDMIEIASGGFSKVASATIKRSKEKCALKFISRGGQQDSQFLFEFSIHARLKHSNVVKCLGFFQSRDHNVLVLEMCSKGDLIDYINGKGFRPCRERSRKYTRELLSALIYIHSKIGIIHGDIKPENVVVNDNDSARLTDFGCAVKMEDYRTPLRYHNGGTLIYRPIEMLRQQNYDSTTDVWAFGCVAYEITFQRHPFFSNWYKVNENKGKAMETAIKKMENILNKNDVFWRNRFDRTPKFRTFLQRIFATKQTERPVSVDLASDPWLQE